MSGDDVKSLLFVIAGASRTRHAMGGAMLQEMMRWLWRDQPVSVDLHDTVERSFLQ